METVFQPRRLKIEAAIRELAAQKNYPLEMTTAQRTMGPRYGCDTAPPYGTEIYVTKIPRLMFENELLPVFEKPGSIYKLRLMMSPSGLSNRGIAFISYDTVEMADAAIQMFDNFEIEPGYFIHVEKSIDNRRLFIGGIPEDKNKNQVWHELQRIGMQGIMDVIMYRSYIDRNRNRGFIFVEFSTHEDASKVRLEYKNAFIFGNRVQVDWSAPQYHADEEIMRQVKKIFMRNLSVLQDPKELSGVILDVLGDDFPVQKIYKCRDYAFLHFISRRDAQRAMTLLREYYKPTQVEICWAKPPPPKRNESQTPPGSPVMDQNNNCNDIIPMSSNNSRSIICPNCMIYMPIKNARKLARMLLNELH